MACPTSVSARSSNKRLQLPPEYFYSVASMSSSTAELSSPALSSRALYAETFERPNTAKSLPARNQHKDMEEVMGQKREVINNESDFNSLPVSVRKKYFSTLERLKFAQHPNVTESDLPRPKSTLADRRGLNVPVIDPSSRRQKSASDKAPKRLRKQPRERAVSAADAAWFANLPDKIKRKHFTVEEQALLGARIQEVIALNKKEEAIPKPSCRARSNTNIPYRANRTPSVATSITLAGTPITPTPSAFAKGTDGSRSYSPPRTSDGVPANMYENFRWMDEEKDLDLKLGFDNYHANLDGVTIPSPTSDRRPSFRRHMSVSKLPLGRPSISALNSRPALQHQRSPTTPVASMYPRPSTHTRSKSRLSIIAPKAINTEPIMIDPNAAHWQDPEARLKLREYLATPQKFDEAIEFGFPAAHHDYNTLDKENMSPNQSRIPRRKSIRNEAGRTFFNDDAASLIGDDVSSTDPDSPKTPSDDECRSQAHQHTTIPSVSSSKNSADFGHLGITKPMVVKHPEAYSQVSAGNREMTLRMTLTRPDLRADDQTIYGWQSRHEHSRADSLGHEDNVMTDVHQRMDGRGPLGGLDGWGPEERESGVLKRVINKFKGITKA